MSETGHNDPCPCGSLLKYKRCCLHRVVPLGSATYRFEVSTNTDESSEDIAIRIHDAVRTYAIRIAIFESDVVEDAREIWERNCLRMKTNDPSGNYDILFDGQTVYLTVMILARASVEELTRAVAKGARGPKLRMTIAAAAKVNNADAFWSEAIKTEVNLRNDRGPPS